MQRSTLISSPSLVALHSSDIYRPTATFHHPLFSHFLVSPPQLSFVLRPRLHAVPPEHQVLACWCQSRSPSWHGTCIDWHRTPAPLWPVPRPLGTPETPYPNSGPPQLLKREMNVWLHGLSPNIYLKCRHQLILKRTFCSYLHSPVHLLGSIISRAFVSSSSSNNTSCFALSSFTCCCLLSSNFSLLLKYCRPWEKKRSY